MDGLRGTAPETADRDWLLSRLGRYVPADAADGAGCRRLARFVAAHPDCFARACPGGHVVASAWVVDRDRTRVLLHHHRRLDKWMQFGGHVDLGDADVLAAARRELREEAGIAGVALGDTIFDLDVHEIPARPGEPAHLHFDVRFAFAADAAETLTVSPESRALRWVPLDAVTRLAPEASIRRMVEKTARLAPRPGRA